MIVTCIYSKHRCVTKKNLNNCALNTLYSQRIKSGNKGRRFCRNIYDAVKQWLKKNTNFFETKVQARSLKQRRGKNIFKDKGRA